jgi:hypothetical protein
MLVPISAMTISKSFGAVPGEWSAALTLGLLPLARHTSG